ncbi:MAG: OmpH family outer membrane protein [Rikenellaceae bacterium]|jgi:outer membrane protein|nr:OmpH family outer membrane protein [Rikenellaceae bacterium]
MKKYLILICAAAFSLAGCNSKGSKSDVGAGDSTQQAVMSSQVAYINLDSLTSRYDMYHDLRGEYEKKAKRIQDDVNGRGRRLEKDVADFQDKIQKGLVTRSTAAQMEEDLGKRQQSFMQFRENSLRDLAEEEQVLLNRIHFSIVDFLKEFNSDYRYAMIISTTAGGPVLNANPALDITAVVLPELNKKYAAEKKGAAAPKTDETAENAK